MLAPTPVYSQYEDIDGKRHIPNSLCLAPARDVEYTGLSGLSLKITQPAIVCTPISQSPTNQIDSWPDAASEKWPRKRAVTMNSLAEKLMGWLFLVSPGASPLEYSFSAQNHQSPYP